jgi:hypothetical protein
MRKKNKDVKETKFEECQPRHYGRGSTEANGNLKKVPMQEWEK